MSEDRSKKNQRLAEWLGFKMEPATTQSIPWVIWPDGCRVNSTHQPDFYESEAASALLLEKMASVNAYVWLEWDINEWCVSWLPTTAEDQDAPMEYSNRDRKTAIAEAADALRLIKETINEETTRGTSPNSTVSCCYLRSRLRDR